MLSERLLAANELPEQMGASLHAAPRGATTGHHPRSHEPNVALARRATALRASLKVAMQGAEWPMTCDILSPKGRGSGRRKTKIDGSRIRRDRRPTTRKTEAHFFSAPMHRQTRSTRSRAECVYRSVRCALAHPSSRVGSREERVRRLSVFGEVVFGSLDHGVQPIGSRHIFRPGSIGSPTKSV